MKIGIITASIHGGAGIAAMRLHNSFKQVGIESVLINGKEHDPVNEIYSSDTLLYTHPLAKILKKIRARKVFKKYIAPFVRTDISFALFSTPFSENRLDKLKLLEDCDVINIHWTSGYLDLPSFLDHIKLPVFLTLHDANYFTAGCHYFNDCDHFEVNCNNCPIIEPQAQQKLSAIFNNKRAAYTQNKPYIIGISEWIATAAKRSTLMKNLEITSIPNAFTPVIPTKHAVLENLKKDKRITVLVIAQHLNDRRKGWAFLEDIIKQNKFPSITWVIVGEGEIPEYEHCLKLGTIHSEQELAGIYDAVDFLVHPAIQDNFPNTVVESLSYGTPVVAFKTSGLQDLINSKNGILAEKVNTDALAMGITKMLGNLSVLDKDEIRAKAHHVFAPIKQGQAYIDFFKQAL